MEGPCLLDLDFEYNHDISLTSVLTPRYDDGPGWSDCDPFELIRYKVLKLIHGGSQCEVMKNITKHCTPHDFPFGTHWLIQVSKTPG